MYSAHEHNAADSARRRYLALGRRTLRALVVEVLGLLMTEAELRRRLDHYAIRKSHLDHHVLVSLLLFEALRDKATLQ